MGEIKENKERKEIEELKEMKEKYSFNSESDEDEDEDEDEDKYEYKYEYKYEDKDEDGVGCHMGNSDSFARLFKKICFEVCEPKEIFFYYKMENKFKEKLNKFQEDLNQLSEFEKQFMYLNFHINNPHKGWFKEQLRKEVFKKTKGNYLKFGDELIKVIKRIAKEKNEYVSKMIKEGTFENKLESGEIRFINF